MMPNPVVILGLGFTTQRLARKLCERNVPVVAAARLLQRFHELEQLGVQLRDLAAEQLPRGATIVHTIPPLPEPEKSALRELIREIAPRRILYISSTGVYGNQPVVSAETAPAPSDDKGRERIEEEAYLATIPNCSCLILRSAAIYGPGRGIQEKLREGKRPHSAGGVVSRIHADDLVALLEAGLDSTLEGAWPVADDRPAASQEVLRWCANYMGVDLPSESAPTFPVAGRSVDGGAIRERLNVRLRYPNYEIGIPASLSDRCAEPASRSDGHSASGPTLHRP